MSANKLFFIGLAIVAVLYFIAVGANAFHGDDKPPPYETEKQQSALLQNPKIKALKTIANHFDPPTAKIDLFNEIGPKNSTNKDQCKLIETAKERVIVLSANDSTCKIHISQNEEEDYRETILFFNEAAPGTVSRGGGIRPVIAKPHRLQQFKPAIIEGFIAAPAAVLNVTLTLILKNKPPKPNSKLIKTNEELKIAVGKNGGILQLSCQRCDRPIYVKTK